MHASEHITLERTGDISKREPGDVPLPVPSFDGRSVEPPAPASVSEQTKALIAEQEAAVMALEAKKQELKDLIAKESQNGTR